MNKVNIESEKKEILRFIEELVAAEKRKDIEGVLKMFADDFVIIYKQDVKIEGKTAITELIKKTIKKFIDAKQIPLRVEVSSSGDMAWLLAYEIFKSEKQEGIFEEKIPYMMAFRKEDGKWKGVAVCEAQRIKLSA